MRQHRHQSMPLIMAFHTILPYFRACRAFRLYDGEMAALIMAYSGGAIYRVLICRHGNGDEHYHYGDR